MKRNLLKWGVVSFLICLTFVFCFSVNPSSAKTIKIAFIGPLTGPNAAQGNGAKNGFDLAIREANKSGAFPFKIEMMTLDEPSLGLAPKLVQEFFQTIVRINKEEKIAILLIEQNAAKALSISDSGYILQKGRIIAQGSAQELMSTDIVKRAYLGQPE